MELTPGRPVNNSNTMLPLSPPTLSDMGIDKMQSSRWQAIAKLPEEVFDFWSSPGVKKYFIECREELDSISGVTYLRIVKFTNPPHSFRR